MNTERTILVVDDDAAIRMFLSDFLTEEGYRVTTVSDGARALAFLQQHIPDVLILDANMPILSGEHLLRAIRTELAPTLPVIVNSGSCDVEDFLPLGATAVLAKPFTLDAMLDVLDTVLGS